MNPSLHPSHQSPRLTLIEVEDIPKSREDDGDFKAALIRVCRDYKRRVVKFMPEVIKDLSACRSVDNAGQQRTSFAVDHSCMETEESSALTNFPVPVLAKGMDAGPKPEASNAQESNTRTSAACEITMADSCGGEFTLPNTIPNTSQAGGNPHAAGLAPLILESV